MSAKMEKNNVREGIENNKEYIKWCNDLYKVADDGIDKFGPELVFGTIHTIEGAYLIAAIDKIKKGEKNGKK